jgi:hypothetical protein
MPGGQFAANHARVSLRKVSSDMAASWKRALYL